LHPSGKYTASRAANELTHMEREGEDAPRLYLVSSDRCVPVVAVQGSDEKAKEPCRNALYTALEAGLRLLHPFMPFITEELWQRLPRRPSDKVQSIMLAHYPDAAWAGTPDAAVEADMERVLAIVRGARDIRTQRGLKPNQAANLTVSCSVCS
jgi:valyl-tRNA synthetase